MGQWCCPIPCMRSAGLPRKGERPPGSLAQGRVFKFLRGKTFSRHLCRRVQINSQFFPGHLSAPLLRFGGGSALARALISNAFKQGKKAGGVVFRHLAQNRVLKLLSNRMSLFKNLRATREHLDAFGAPVGFMADAS